MKCTICNKLISKARLKALPSTQTCVKCSQVKACVGVIVWDKTTPSLFLVDEEEAENHFRWQRKSFDFCQL